MNDDTDNDPCMVAWAECGHIVYASVIDNARFDPSMRAERRREQAKEASRLIRAGYKIGTITAAEVRAADWCPSDCERRKNQAATKRRSA